MITNDSIKPENIYWVIVKSEKDTALAAVCGSCLLDEHQNGSIDHRLGNEGRRDCKNTDHECEHQCYCTPDWHELYELIQKKPTIYDSEHEARLAMQQA